MIISTDQLLYVLCALKLINLLLQSDLDNKSIPSSSITTTSTSKPSTTDHKPQQNSTQNNVSTVHTLPQHHVNNSANMNSTMEVDTDQDGLAFLAEMLMETTTGYQPQNFAAVMTTSPSVHNLQYTASPSYYSNPASMQACFCVQLQN